MSNHTRINKERHEERLSKKVKKEIELLSDYYEVTPDDEQYYAVQRYLENI